MVNPVPSFGLEQSYILILFIFCRYFTGHTTNSDGTVQFVKGKTKVDDILDGVVKIVTIAVS